MFTPEDPIQAAREQFMLERFNEQVQAELARLRAQAGRSPTQPTPPAVRLVSLNSALQALNHVSFYNGCGRLAEATAMLVEAQPAPVVPDLTDAELNAIWVDQDNAGRRMNFRLGYRLAQKLATPKPSIQDLTDRARAKGVVAVAQDAPVVPAWQSIETAPKGGVLVDILCDGRRYAGCHYDRICDEFRHITACGVLVHLKKASHWMAVPAAPQPLPLHNVGGNRLAPTQEQR